MTYADVPPHVQDPDKWEEERERKAFLLRNVITGDALAKKDFPPLHYAVPGVIPEGLSILVGAPKLGKSWLVLGVALALADGGKALGSLDIAEPSPVLYLALEDGHRRLQDRCAKLQLRPRDIPANLHFLTELEPATCIETVRAWVDAYGSQVLVIIDTAGRIMPQPIAGESSYSRDYRFGASLKKIADDHPGLALVVVHHTRKARAGDWLEDVSGTNGLPGAADSVLVLDRPRGSGDGILKVTGRDVIEAEYAMTNDGGIWRLAGDGLKDAAARAADIKATDNLGENSAAIVAYVNRHETGVRAGEVALALALDQENVKRTLARLENAGRICKPTRGLYAPIPTPVPTVPSVPFADDEGTHGTDGTHTAGDEW